MPTVHTPVPLMYAPQAVIADVAVAGRQQVGHRDTGRIRSVPALLDRQGEDDVRCRRDGVALSTTLLSDRSATAPGVVDTSA